MSLEKSNMPLSAKQVAVMDSNNKFNYNHIVQRSFVWETSRSSKLIESMMLGYPIPQVYCRRDRDEDQPKKKGASTYVVMDGQQRLKSISKFLNNEYALTELDPVTYTTYDGEDVTEDVSNKKFEDLPEELQDTIKDTSINFICFDNITFEEERELFKRLNAGKPLSTKARIVANCADLENVLNIGKHPLFSDMLTENALNAKSQVSIIMKIWSMLNMGIEDISFESKIFNPMIEDTIISDSENAQIKEVLDYLSEVHECLMGMDDKSAAKVAKKLYTETHLVSFVPAVKVAIENEVDAFLFGDFVRYFFGDGATIAYNEACLSGSAKNDKITIRNIEIAEAYNQFFQVA